MTNKERFAALVKIDGFLEKIEQGVFVGPKGELLRAIIYAVLFVGGLTLSFLAIIGITNWRIAVADISEFMLGISVFGVASCTWFGLIASDLDFYLARKAEDMFGGKWQSWEEKLSLEIAGYSPIDLEGYQVLLAGRDSQGSIALEKLKEWRKAESVKVMEAIDAEKGSKKVSITLAGQN